MDNKRHGFGVRTYGNGDIYEGMWKEGKRDGRGRMAYKSGTVYEVGTDPAARYLTRIRI